MIYKNMKNSGIPWIGDIPSHWKITRSKMVFQNVTIKNHPDAMVLSLYRDLGVLPKESRDDNYNVTSEDTAQYKFVEAGNLVINKMKAWQGSLAVSGYSGIVSPAYYVCRFRSDAIEKRYIHYLLRCVAYAQEFERLSTGMRVGQWDLGIDDFLKIPILLPDADEQKSIADFLDAKCGGIDAIIDEAKASIEEYKRWKASVIYQAVTKGLDPDASMKDSGIFWIGKIPSHWHCQRLKYLFAIKKDIAGELGFTVLSITQQGIKPKDMSDKGQFSLDYSKYQLVSPGDFAMNHMDLLTGGVDISKYSGVTSPDYRVFYSRNPDSICADYYKYVFQVCYRQRIFYGLGQGVAGFGRWRLPADMFLNFSLPTPPLQEQFQIAESLNSKCENIDAIISEKQSLIAELEAYKKSLIYEVVTGKRKVG